MSRHNLKIPGNVDVNSNPQNSADNIARKDKLHPLEVKYGKEPKIEPQERWSWH
ncbi:MAG: hypothetical protein ACW97X_10960 [Candidatus Hodarchaeales archaeon]